MPPQTSAEKGAFVGSDFNGDGKPDLAVPPLRTFSPEQGGNNAVIILLNITR